MERIQNTHSFARVHCSLMYHSNNLDITEYPTIGEQLSTLGYRYLKEYYPGF